MRGRASGSAILEEQQGLRAGRRRIVAEATTATLLHRGPSRRVCRNASAAGCLRRRRFSGLAGPDDVSWPGLDLDHAAPPGGHGLTGLTGTRHQLRRKAQPRLTARPIWQATSRDNPCPRALDSILGNPNQRQLSIEGNGAELPGGPGTVLVTASKRHPVSSLYGVQMAWSTRLPVLPILCGTKSGAAAA
jgi:hypothetical protein